MAAKLFCKKQGGGVKTAVDSELSLVSGNYHDNKVSVVMKMASFCLKIRHVFGDTLLTERRIGTGPPVIIQLSGKGPGTGRSHDFQHPDIVGVIHY
jgi:hypothetical protein